jgi:hypothetical protein
MTDKYEDKAREIIEGVLQNANCPAIERDSIEDAQLSSYMKVIQKALNDAAKVEWPSNDDIFKTAYTLYPKAKQIDSCYAWVAGAQWLRSKVEGK